MNVQAWQGVNAADNLLNFGELEQNAGMLDYGRLEQKIGTGKFIQAEDLWAPIHHNDTEALRNIELNTDELRNIPARETRREFNADNLNNATFKQDMAALNAEISRIDTQLNTMNATLAKKKAQLEERKKELETKEQQLNDAKEKLLIEEQKLQDIQNNIAAKNKEKQEIQNKLEGRQNDLIIKFGEERNEALKKAQAEYDPQKDGDYNTYLENKLKQVAYNPSISNEIAELNNSLTGLNNTLNTLNNQYISQQNIVKNATQNVNNLQNEVFRLNNTITSLETEVNTIENDIRTAEATKTTTQNKLDEITAGLHNTEQIAGHTFNNLSAEDMQNLRNNIQHNRIEHNTRQPSPDILQNIHNITRETIHRQETAPLNPIKHDTFARTIAPAHEQRTITPAVERNKNIK